MRGEKFFSQRQKCRPSEDHPRLRGEKLMQKLGLPLSTGDHPRLRGEKKIPLEKSTGDPGSPPLARGKEEAKSSLSLEQRITPACAGKSEVISCIYTRWGDHPRLARGKGSRSFSGIVMRRITPACAGKRDSDGWCKAGSQDHPRLRGEKPTVSHRPTKGEGSPPLARGKAGRCRNAWDYIGITPACAGKRALRNGYDPLLKDHPRLRGEKKTPREKPTRGPGDHPRLRGERVVLRSGPRR